MGAHLMLNNGNLISSDIYDLTEFVKQLKKKYIPLQDEDTLYISTFGYIGDIAANLMQNSVIAASEYSNEAIPTRAKFDRNVIIHAMTLGIDKVHATPATMPIVLCIPESCVVQNLGNNKTGERQEGVFTIDHTIPFTIEGVEFHLDYDINITRYKKEYKPTPTTGDPDNLTSVIYTARYDMSVPNPVSDIDNEILPTVGVFRYADIFQNSLAKADNVLVIYTKLSQVMYHEEEVVVSSDNDLLNKTISFQFSDQLAYFDVAVYEANADTPRVLTPIYDGLYKDGVTNYCYYSYMNSNSIRIRFDRDVYQPRMNSRVVVRIYTTLGSGGNFKYSENVRLQFPSTSKADYNSVFALIQQRGDGATDGLDRASTKQLQEIIPKEMLSRGFITTNTDLQNYFNSLSTENSIVYVFRKEDSFLKRTYYSYSLMKDDEGNIIPTNTIPIEIEGQDVNSIDVSSIGFLEAGTTVFLPVTPSTTDQPVVALPVNMKNAMFNLPEYDDNDRITGQLLFCDANFNTFASRSMATVGNAIVLRTIINHDYELYERGEHEHMPSNPIPLNGQVNKADFTKAWNANSAFIYTVPYSIVVSQPRGTLGMVRPRCSFIVDTIDENKFTTFEWINEKSTVQFIASNVRVSRPSFMCHDRYVYYLDIDLTPNQNKANIDINKIQTTAVFKIDGEAKGYVTGYHIADLDDEESIHFRFRFETEPLATAWYENKLRVSNIYTPGYTDKSIDPVKLFPEKIDVDIFTMYHYAAERPCKTIGESFGGGDLEAGEIAMYQPVTFAYPFQLRDTDRVGPEGKEYMKYFAKENDTDQFTNPHPIYTEYATYKKYADFIEDNPRCVYAMGNMVLTNKYSITSGINLYYNYSDYMDSHVSVSEASAIGHSYDFTLNRIPVIRMEYLESEERVQFTMNELRKAMIYVSNSVGKLETLFGIDFKLFNSYGPSKTYSIEDSNGSLYPLNQVNLTLNFRAQLYTDADKNIISQIKSDIKSYIEDIKEIKNIHMPNLISEITKKYGGYLVYFEFVGFQNEIGKYNALYQHIITNKDMEQLKEVPEFLNINFNTLSSAPDINIDIIV